MRTSQLLLAATAIATSTSARAADQLKFGNAPAWVIPQIVPKEAGKSPEAPVALLLVDQQIQFQPGKTITYGELAIKVQTPEGLSAGNISLPWNPATDTLTINKLEIRRGSQVIDVLASGQTFTTMRRESNLELATLDGVLTANIQPDGLQQGDIIDLATTDEHIDPVVGNHVESMFAQWEGRPIGLAHVRLEWPSSMTLSVRTSGGLQAVQPVTHDGRKIIEITAHDVEPDILPKGAPARFKLGRLGEATDFTSWADVAKLTLPLFREAESIGSSGPLHDEVEKIRSATRDPRERALEALELVQQRIRYVALLMGQGSYVPAKAETTWSRRFGDCKAKTALLLGILHSLGIEAEPILVQSRFGDAIADRLPLLSYFDHVLVRAHIANRIYYLDGTRIGDTNLDDIEVPDFRWGLPLIAQAKLVSMVPSPRNDADHAVTIDIDARAGALAPAKVTITELLHGDSAIGSDIVYARATRDQQQQVLTDAAKGYFDGFSMESSSVKFDKDRRDLTVQMIGSAPLQWKDGWYFIPAASIGYKPDLDRPAGPVHDAPFTVSFPVFTRTKVTLHLPAGFAAQQKMPTAVRQTLGGVEYVRTATLNGDDLTIETSQRSIVPEIPYKEAMAEAPRIKALDDEDVYLKLVGSYQPTQADVKSVVASTPISSSEFARRGQAYLNSGKIDEAIADLSQALVSDPHNVAALAERATAFAWKHDFAKSEADLAAADAIEPRNFMVLSTKALKAELQGKYSEAVEFYTKSLALQPTNAFLLGHRAISEENLGQRQAALDDSLRALKTIPTWISLRLLRANILTLEHKPDLVAAEANAMTNENPHSAYAFVAAAKTYSALGERARAMKSFEEALAIKPEPYIYVNRSQVRPRSDVSGRLADLDAALKLEPNHPASLQAKAQLLLEMGNAKGALALLDLVKLPADTDSTYANYVQQQRAIALYKAGRTNEAVKLLADLSARASGATELNNICYTQATAGIRLEAALQDCRKALKLDPGSGAFLDSLGMVLLKLGRFDEALAAYNQAITKGEGAPSLMGRAFVYLKLGDRARAQSDALAARKLVADIDDIFAGYDLKFDAGSAAVAGATGDRAPVQH